MLINGEYYKLKITFRNVLQIFQLFEDNNPQRIKKSLEILGLKNISNPEYVLDSISQYIFDTTKKTGNGKCKKDFDINYDYQYYFPDFLKYGINLNKDDIDWWEFNKILDAIIIDKNSNMHQVLEYRNYEKPIKNEKTRENIRHQQMMNLKQKYALPIKNEDGISKLWNYLEKKAGDNKEKIKT